MSREPEILAVEYDAASGFTVRATRPAADIRASFPWMPDILWTATIADGPHLHATGDTKAAAIARWIIRHGDPASYRERMAA